MQESAAIYQHYFLTALGYSNYSPREQTMEAGQVSKILQEASNGAIQHHHYYLQAYPYPSAGDYENVKHPVRKTAKGPGGSEPLLRWNQETEPYEDPEGQPKELSPEVIETWMQNLEKRRGETREQMWAKAKKEVESQRKNFSPKKKSVNEGVREIRKGRSAKSVVEDLI